MKPDSQTIISMMDGYKKSFILAASSKLNLFDKIHQCADIEKLVSDCHMPNEVMPRFLRVLESMGLVNIKENQIELTPLGLCTQTDQTLRDYLLISSNHWMEDWSDLLSILSHGKQSDGSSWEKRAKNPKSDLAFHHFMGHSNAIQFPVNIEQGTIVDIGGGLGFTLASLLDDRPDVSGILFDLPHVIEHAKKSNSPIKKYEKRCKFIGGSFLEQVPNDGDLYLLHNILHDWNDEYTQTILRNCHQSMQSRARLVISETWIPEHRNDEYASMTDLHLMVVHGGRKRTQKEYQAMVSSIGFKMISQDENSIEVGK